MKVKEFIDFVNENEFWCLNDLDNSDLEEIKDVIMVDEGLFLDKHRWYSTAVDVYKLEDGFVGVWGVNDVYSEWSYVEDLNIKCGASEMIEVPTVTYKWKK